MNRVTHSKTQPSASPPPAPPTNRLMTAQEFLGCGQKIAIEDAAEHVRIARAYTDTAVNVDRLLRLADNVLAVALHRIEAGS